MSDEQQLPEVPEEAVTQPPQRNPELAKQARTSVLLYGAARLGLFIALTVCIQLLALAIGAPVPIYISAMLALIVALPLSVFVFKSLRIRATEAVADWDTQRKAYKQWVKSELSSR
ncbi:MAG: DUF4229 domain-containing protein [Corynebacterium sp.]|uniref:DUF4229 domain-containing protein n=1 Tax=Corynebacterium sp. TaxID=1720 RepID=UPI0026DC790A|nr:DUF4229 domain-containing protein [Corynebacterium sp.]MDO5098972.1 DUF4229 domain-containing protein [Corynebacterium sp.]